MNVTHKRSDGFNELSKYSQIYFFLLRHVCLDLFRRTVTLVSGTGSYIVDRVLDFIRNSRQKEESKDVAADFVT